MEKVYVVFALNINADYPYLQSVVSYHRTKEGADKKLDALKLLSGKFDEITGWPEYEWDTTDAFVGTIDIED